MLAYRFRNCWVEWRPGTRLPAKFGRKSPPANAEQLLNDTELRDLGLARVTRKPVPVGRAVTGWRLTDMDGQPQLVPVTKAARPQIDTPDPLLARIEALEAEVAALKKRLA
jgi:hypothetical protein